MDQPAQPAAPTPEAAAAAPSTPPAQAMDVVAPPPTDTPGEAPTEQPAADSEPKQQSAKAEKAPKPPKPPKQPGSSVGLAIFATIVIVLGLAALATYAYLQTSK